MLSLWVVCGQWIHRSSLVWRKWPAHICTCLYMSVYAHTPAFQSEFETSLVYVVYSSQDYPMRPSQKWNKILCLNQCIHTIILWFYQLKIVVKACVVTSENRNPTPGPIWWKERTILIVSSELPYVYVYIHAYVYVSKLKHTYTL